MSLNNHYLDTTLQKALFVLMDVWLYLVSLKDQKVIELIPSFAVNFFDILPSHKFLRILCDGFVL